MLNKKYEKDNILNKTDQLKKALSECDTVIIGAGAGLSTAAGFIYTGQRFEKYFSDFAEKYDFKDMYSGGFYPYKTLEEHWAYWSRYIFVNRYMNPPKPVYERLFELVKEKDYFVLTTNVDHCFQKAGFDKHRIFYTQGDYGLFQCSKPCHDETYDNEELVRKMVEAQGFVVKQASNDAYELCLPENREVSMTIPTELVPRCPKCNRPMNMNLRADDTFVEDEGWHVAADRYSQFLRRHKNTKTLFMELGVGYNTPGIIKYSFWNMVYNWPDAMYACLNFGEAYAPEEIAKKSICINDDTAKILDIL
jgi:NAD-dependent SIR2 family protein deacetylase